MYRQRQPEPRKNPSERSRQSKRLVFRRSMVLMGVFGLGLYIPLLIQLWNIAIVHHDEYQTKAIEQQLMDVTVSANRGEILDANGDVLAMSATVYNLILAPKDLVASVRVSSRMRTATWTRMPTTSRSSASGMWWWTACVS